MYRLAFLACLLSTTALAETVIVPPDPNLNPLTMTDEELAAHPEIPPKPSDPEGLAAWNRSMEHYHQGETSGTIRGVTDLSGNPAPAQYATYNTNDTIFAGVQTQNNIGGVTTSNAYTLFTIPYYVKGLGSCPANESLSHWVGIQGGGLLQAGLLVFTQWNSACQLTSWAFTPFWEDYPANLPQTFPIAKPTVGNQIFAQVWNTTATQGYAKFTNLSTGASVTIARTTSWSMTGRPWYLWLTEAQGNMPRFGCVNFSASAQDQLGRVYAPGRTTYSDLIYKSRVRSGLTYIRNYPISFQTFQLCAK